MDLAQDVTDDEGNLEAKPSITFQAAVYKVQTLTDGGVRISLDLPETAIPQMAMLAECQRAGIYLDVVCTEYSPFSRTDNGENNDRTKRKRSVYKGE